jgi:hypothetical protein
MGDGGVHKPFVWLQLRSLAAPCLYEVLSRRLRRMLLHHTVSHADPHAVARLSLSGTLTPNCI